MFAALIPPWDSDWKLHDKLRDSSPTTFFVVLLIVGAVLAYLFKRGQ